MLLDELSLHAKIGMYPSVFAQTNVFRVVCLMCFISQNLDLKISNSSQAPTQAQTLFVGKVLSRVDFEFYPHIALFCMEFCASQCFCRVEGKLKPKYSVCGWNNPVLSEPRCEI